MSDEGKPGEAIGAGDEALVALLKGLAMAIPTFAEWLFSDDDDPDPIVRRVREIMPEKSRSREAAERMIAERAAEKARQE